MDCPVGCCLNDHQTVNSPATIRVRLQGVSPNRRAESGNQIVKVDLSRENWGSGEVSDESGKGNIRCQTIPEEYSLGIV
jgi:hypothetical protein